MLLRLKERISYKNVRFDKRAFSLIELMVAVTILMVIILVMSSIFHQSTIAWDGGNRKAEGGMTARAALGLMARELSYAVGNNAKFNQTVSIPNGPGAQSISFISLSNDKVGGSAPRLAKKIKYSWSPDGKLTRTVYTPSSLNYTNAQWSQTSENQIADKVKDINVTTSDGQPHNGDLPAWVKLQMTLTREADVSKVAVVSAGPDGNFGTKDDIKSYATE